MRLRIQAIVDDIVNHVEPRGHMDLIADFAYRLPVTVICDMLGIPEGDREVFHAGSRTGGRLLDLAPLSPFAREPTPACPTYPGVARSTFGYGER